MDWRRAAALGRVAAVVEVRVITANGGGGILDLFTTEGSAARMLILSRQKSQRIVFPTLDIVVEVVEIRGDKVRLGIAAGANVPVHREEVWQAIQREQAVPKVSTSP